MKRYMKTTYVEAMERSWPHGRFLVGLMDGVSKTKSEPVELRSLRLARDTLDAQIEPLAKQRANIQASLEASCSHPIDLLYVEEFEIAGGDAMHYAVRCKACRRVLRDHTRRHTEEV